MCNIGARSLTGKRRISKIRAGSSSLSAPEKLVAINNQMLMEKEIGTVKHFFPHIPAAVVELKEELKTGDEIVVKSKTGEEKFRQVVDSMQVDRKDIKSGKSGDEIAIKVNGKAKEGDIVCIAE